MEIEMNENAKCEFARLFALTAALMVAAVLALTCAPVAKMAYADPGVTVGNVQVSKVTQTNAFLEATAYKSPDVKVYSCGIYLGTSPDDMTKQNTEIVPDVSNAYHNGNDFDIWYDLNDELKITLEPGTTYYFKFYCMVDGSEYSSEMQSFTTEAPAGAASGSAEEHVEKQESVRGEVNAAVSKFEDETGLVEAGDAAAYIDAAYACLRESTSDEIADVGKNDSCAWVEFRDGSAMLCAPQVEGVSSMPVDQVCSIQTWEPCNDTYSSSVASYIAMVGQAAKVLVGKSGYWHNDVSMEDSQVTLEALKELGLDAGNEIIIWHGHGAYYSDKGEVLIVGEKWSAERRMGDKAYNDEFTSGNVVFYTNGDMAITSKFVREYCDRLDGALVYLGACWSGYDSTLADAFVAKGAKTVVGFSQSVQTSYDCAFALELSKALCSMKSNGRYYSAEEALDQAKNALGQTDADRYHGEGARAKLFGDGDFCFDESLDDVYGAYLERVQEYQARYGEHQVKTVGQDGAEMYAVVGVGYVDIIDFDGDGTDELVVAYGDESKLDPDDPFEAYTLEVWGYENGKVKTVYSVGPHKGDGVNFEVADAVMFDIAKAKGEGKPSFIRSISGGDILYSTLENGAFVTVDTLTPIWSGSEMEFYVNGSKVSESEFGRIEEKYDSGDCELSTVIMGDFAWNGDPYDFEYELFIDTDNAIGRLMIGTTDAADDDYRDNNGWNEKSDSEGAEDSPENLAERFSEFLFGKS